MRLFELFSSPPLYISHRCLANSFANGYSAYYETERIHCVLVRVQVDKEVNLLGNEKVLKDYILDTFTLFVLLMDDLALSISHIKFLIKNYQVPLLLE
jgi:hypothetical protein